MSYLSAATLAQNSDFRNKVLIAIVTAAINIVGETPSGDEITDSKRKFLGIQVLNNANNYVDRFAIAVVANPAITTLSLDGDIQFTVNSLWNDMAGV